MSSTTLSRRTCASRHPALCPKTLEAADVPAPTSANLSVQMYNAAIIWAFNDSYIRRGELSRRAFLPSSPPPAPSRRASHPQHRMLPSSCARARSPGVLSIPIAVTLLPRFRHTLDLQQVAEQRLPQRRTWWCNQQRIQPSTPGPDAMH
ncbi:hypothetical protein B0H11DRAFT_2214066 [Mycena galericulata]|nr:hypothetical protein B0H11DRAFT_2214066 [Mycena galericulata]